MSTRQHIEIANATDASLAVHLTAYGGGFGNTFIAPGGSFSMDSGPGTSPVRCVGLHGKFRGSPYATCLEENGTLSVTVTETGVAGIGTGARS
ncbi:hypothetical protein [Pandoravirus japonicus]|uniref:Uncharacterized protein n=1 Tax=Pandoravirus japonicus TaxID=2823154 RepID=A0A811BSF5_9VIRU|nr:hypothetical protein [Pandoravirus japonicus]